MFKLININQLFSLHRGKSIYTRAFGNENKGLFPVFSAGDKPLTYINTYDYDGEYLTWATNGFAGFLKIIKGKFSINSDRGIFIPINKDVNLKFILYSIQSQLRDLTKGRIGDKGKNEFTKLSPQKIVDSIYVSMPIDKTGEFDLETQNRITYKYENLAKIKDRIRILYEDLESTEVSLEYEYEGVEKNIFELFNVGQGNAFYTKKRILENNWVGEIPVYSSNTKEDGRLIGIKEKNINQKDLFYQNCITWSVDGYAGKMFIRNQENLENKKDEKYYFTVNNHCGIMIPKVKGLSLPFIKVILQHKFFERAKGYGNNKLGNNQISDLTVNIPIDSFGNFDLLKQQEIAQKYQKIEHIKKTLLDEIEHLAKIKVEI